MCWAVFRYVNQIRQSDKFQNIEWKHAMQLVTELSLLLYICNIDHLYTGNIGQLPFQWSIIFCKDASLILCTDVRIILHFSGCCQTLEKRQKWVHKDCCSSQLSFFQDYLSLQTPQPPTTPPCLSPFTKPYLIFLFVFLYYTLESCQSFHRHTKFWYALYDMYWEINFHKWKKNQSALKKNMRSVIFYLISCWKFASDKLNKMCISYACFWHQSWWLLIGKVEQIKFHCRRFVHLQTSPHNISSTVNHCALCTAMKTICSPWFIPNFSTFSFSAFHFSSKDN